MDANSIQDLGKKTSKAIEIEESLNLLRAARDITFQKGTSAITLAFTETRVWPEDMPKEIISLFENLNGEVKKDGKPSALSMCKQLVLDKNLQTIVIEALIDALEYEQRELHADIKSRTTTL